MKKVLGLILFLLLVSAAVIAAADTVAGGDCLVVYGTDPYRAGGDINHSWKLLDTGELIISGSGALKAYSTYTPWNNTKYQGCGDYRDQVTSITVEEGTTELPANIFREFNYLESVKLPDSLKVLNSYAFEKCPHLKSVEFGSGLIEIGSHVFLGSILKELDLPDHLEVMTTDSFFTVTHANIILYTTVGSTTAKTLSLNKYTFRDHAYPGLDMKYVLKDDHETVENLDVVGSESSIASIVWPEGVTRIMSYAFSKCSALETVEIPEGVTLIGREAFYQCTKLAGVTLPASVTEISGRVFYGDSLLKELVLPENITIMDNEAFLGCSALRYTAVGSVTAKTMAKCPYSFRNKKYPGIDLQYTLDEAGEIDQYYVVGSDADIAAVEWPEGITQIGKSAFKDRTSLKKVDIPAGVTAINQYAFSGCSSLEKVSIPEGVTFIGREAFYQCTKLAGVTLPDSINEMSGRVFYGDSLLKKLALPDHISVLDSETFLGCPALRYTAIGSATAMEMARHKISFRSRNYPGIDLLYVLKDDGRVSEFRVVGADKTIRSAVIPSGVTEIGGSAFSNCAKMKSATIPKSVKSIGNSAFNGCTGLKDVYLESTPEKWEKVTIGSSNKPLQNATLHFPGLSTVIVTVSNSSWGTAFAKPVYAKPGTTVTLTAEPKAGYWLKEWKVVSGKVTIRNNKFKIGTEDVTVKAVFEKQTDISQKGKISDIKDQVYTGKAVKPAVTVKNGTKKLAAGKDYKVSWKNNKDIGTATVTVTGIGKYTGSLSKTFRINPKPVALSSLKAGKKLLTVKWKKGGKITGYQIEYSLNKDFSAAEQITVSNGSTVSTKISGLAKGKTYYVRIRTFKTVNGTRYYSAWSKAMHKKVK